MTVKSPVRPFTGRRMAIILVAFFGVVVAVNVVMATFASRTFGGLVVENSYIASQKFNGWLEKAREEKTLDWGLSAARRSDGRLDVTLASADQPLTDAQVTALARHPLGRLPERSLRFQGTGSGRYESLDPLPAGRWIVHVEARAHGRTIHRIVDVQ